MRIGYDLRPFLRHETGVGVYFRQLLSELARNDAENEYFLFSCSWKDRFPRERVPSFARGHFRDARVPVRAMNWMWYKLGRPRLDFFFGQALDITHSPVPLALPTRGKKVITVCDLFFLDHPELADREARAHFSRSAGRAIERADGVITISEFSRRAILDRFRVDERKVAAIHLGVGLDFFQPMSRDDLERVRKAYELPEVFLLFVGALEPRKNLARLIQAFKVVKQRLPDAFLVIVGRSGGDEERLRNQVHAEGLEERVKFLGYLPESDVRGVYRLATALVFPSLVEGFGLPLLEAMASGLAVAASGTSAIPEVAGDAAVYFDPQSPEDMAAKIIQLVENKPLQKELAASGLARTREFDWAKTARETLNFYRSL